MTFFIAIGLLRRLSLQGSTNSYGEYSSWLTTSSTQKRCGGQLRPAELLLQCLGIGSQHR